MGGYFHLPAAIFSIAAAFASVPTMIPMLPSQELELRLEAIKHRKKAAVASAPVKYRRGRRLQAKPKKRANRMHISKRVRRKHRRAA